MDILPGLEDFQIVLPTQNNGTALPLVLEAGDDLTYHLGQRDIYMIVTLDFL